MPKKTKNRGVPFVTASKLEVFETTKVNSSFTARRVAKQVLRQANLYQITTLLRFSMPLLKLAE